MAERTTTSPGLPSSDARRAAKAICNVRLAVDGDDGQTRWYTVTAWEPLAEAVGAHVKKGDRLGVRGPLGVLHLHRRKPAGATGAGA